MPTGISFGENAVLAITSQMVTSAAPQIADSDNVCIDSFPAISLTAWGTTRPTKPIRPPKLTAEPDRSAASNRKMKRMRLIESPSDSAISSPRDRTSS